MRLHTHGCGPGEMSSLSFTEGLFTCIPGHVCVSVSVFSVDVSLSVSQLQDTAFSWSPPFSTPSATIPK